jgi:hypothetical protein
VFWGFFLGSFKKTMLIKPSGHINFSFDVEKEAEFMYYGNKEIE